MPRVCRREPMKAARARAAGSDQCASLLSLVDGWLRRFPLIVRSVPARRFQVQYRAALVGRLDWAPPQAGRAVSAIAPVAAPSDGDSRRSKEGALRVP